MSRRAIFAGMSGTIFQWYDFSLFGYFAVTFSHVFFPKGHPFVALLSTFGIFAVGYLLAPLGAIFFGHIGDRYGRKRALTLSILLMTIPTTLMACLPGYHTIGIFAPIILTLLRLIQGFVASAEFAGSAIFLVEHAPVNKKTFYASLSSSSYSVGMIIGAVMAFLFTLPFMPYWAWRIPFSLAIFAGLIILYLRNRASETPIFKDMQQRQKQRAPLVTAVKNDPLAIVITIGLAAFIGIVSFGSYVYMVTYLHTVSALSLNKAILVVSLGLLVDACVEPLIALKADRIGRTNVIKFGAILMAALVMPIYFCLASGDIVFIVIGTLSLSLLIAITFAPMNALMTLMYAPEYRYSGFSVFFNIGISLFGGTAPLVLYNLVHHYHTIYGPVSYYLFAILLGFISLGFSRKMVKNQLKS